MEYELINPSDPYTFIADGAETAALVVFMLSLAYGANDKEGDITVPIFLFGESDSEDWYIKQFGRNSYDGLKAKRKEVSDALKSMMLVHFEDRQRYEAALSAITEPDKREKFIADWQDDCSSLNDIGTLCHKMAEKLANGDTLKKVFSNDD